MRAAWWALAAVLALTACRGEAVPADTPPSTTEIIPASTTKVEECSWCPATGTTEETAASSGPAKAQVPDLMDHLASRAEGTPFADLTEEEVRSDISDICGAGEGGASRRGAAAEAARLRAARMGVEGSTPGAASYAQLLETEAAHRCP